MENDNLMGKWSREEGARKEKEMKRKNNIPLI